MTISRPQDPARNRTASDIGAPAQVDLRGSTGPSERASRNVKLASLGPLLVIALCVARSPTIMWQGRLWAEESVFLAHALTTKSLLKQLFYVYRGHLELLNSTVFTLASHLGLEAIPLVTTYSGLSVECILAFMIVFFRSDLGITLRSALLICVLIVVSPCAVEHYLNVLNSVWLTSAILLLMISLSPDQLTKGRLTVVPVTLILGLSGMPAACLMPLALLHAVVLRSRPHGLIAATLTLCCLIQGALVLVHGTPGRFSSVSAWVYLSSPFFHLVVEHLFGVDAASALGHWFKDSAMTSTALPSMMLAPLALFAWTIVRIVRRGEIRSRLLLVAFVYTTAFNITFALGDRNDLFSVYGMRYFFVPGFALALLLARMDQASSNWVPGLALGAMILMTLLSARDFFQNPFYRTYVEPRHAWRQEVDRCKSSAASCAIEIDPGGISIDIPEGVLRRSDR